MKHKIPFIIVILLLAAIGIMIYCSAGLTTTYYEYESSRIPSSFDGFRITVLSDIHCKSFGKNNEKMVEAIKAAEPDLILILGDSVDHWHRNDFSALVSLFSRISSIAPVYAISGNHECANPELYSQLCVLYKQYRIENLDDSEVIFSYQGDSIILKGLGAFENKVHWDKSFLINDHPEAFTILLDHYPQLNRLASYGYDLLLSGHVHGGIIRLPILGGLIGNDRQLFPEYSAGQYQLLDTTMYVSRGIGNSAIPRINNNPEIVCITLHSIAD